MLTATPPCAVPQRADPDIFLAQLLASTSHRPSSFQLQLPETGCSTQDCQTTSQQILCLKHHTNPLDVSCSSRGAACKTARLPAHLLQAALGGAICCKARCGVAVCSCAVHVEHMASSWLLLHEVDGLHLITTPAARTKCVEGSKSYHLPAAQWLSLKLSARQPRDEVTKQRAGNRS